MGLKPVPYLCSKYGMSASEARKAILSGRVTTGSGEAVRAYGYADCSELLLDAPVKAATAVVKPVVEKKKEVKVSDNQGIVRKSVVKQVSLIGDEIEP